MSLPNPFNSVADLVLWSGFRYGTHDDQESVLKGSFDYSQFTTALAEARREIYRKTRQMNNDEFDEDRKDELKEAERYLATARLYPNYAARMTILFPESNIQSVGEVMSGADTPSPYEKQAQLINLMTTKLRQYGLRLLEADSQKYVAEIGTIDLTKTYPALSAY